MIRDRLVSPEILTLEASRGKTCQPKPKAMQIKATQLKLPARSKQVKFCHLTIYKSRVKFCFQMTKSSLYEVKKKWRLLKNSYNKIVYFYQIQDGIHSVGPQTQFLSLTQNYFD